MQERSTTGHRTSSVGQRTARGPQAGAHPIQPRDGEIVRLLPPGLELEAQGEQRRLEKCELALQLRVDVATQSRRLLQLLVDASHDSSTVSDQGLDGAPDDAVLDCARVVGRAQRWVPEPGWGGSSTRPQPWPCNVV